LADENLAANTANGAGLGSIALSPPFYRPLVIAALGGLPPYPLPATPLVHCQSILVIFGRVHNYIMSVSGMTVVSLLPTALNSE